MIKQDKLLQELARFLINSRNIKIQWSASQYRVIRLFNNGLEKLYQIVSRKFPSDPCGGECPRSRIGEFKHIIKGDSGAQSSHRVHGGIGPSRP